MHSNLQILLQIPISPASLQQIKRNMSILEKMLEIPHGENQSFILLASEPRKLSRDNYIKMKLFDGVITIKAILKVAREDLDLTAVAEFNQEKDGYEIQVLQHLIHTYENSKLCQIVNFKPVIIRKKAGQSPTLKEAKTEEMLTVKKEHTKNRFLNPKRQQATSPAPNMNVMDQQKQFIQVSQLQLRNYQKINDLYPDFPGWQLIIRVLEKNYRQFISKIGKQTKILTILMMDRMGSKIQAVLFGDDAKQLEQKLEINALYRLSRGQIKENTYVRDDSLSKYMISLNSHSLFQRVEQNSSIPSVKKQILGLVQVVHKGDGERLYDVFVVLLKVLEQKRIQKEMGKVIIKQSLIIGDLQKKRSLQAIIWGGNIEIQQNFIGKVVLLRKFRLSSYKDTLSLCSTFKSSIQIYSHTKACKIQTDEANYLPLSSSQPVNDNHKQVIKTIIDLQNQITYLSPNQSITSELDFWLTFVNFKGKWFYQACNNPKCKKSAEEEVHCLHCNTFNEKLSKKYILPIQVTDFTGSLWTTAFDDFAGQIFHGMKITDLIGKSDILLKQQGEKRLYRQYRGKITTKKIQDGTIRHTIVGKPVQIDIKDALQSNLSKIKRAIDQ